VARALISAGADIHLSDHGGRIPLHAACANARAATIKLLLDSGASPLAKDHSGCTPKDWATAQGKRMTLELLEGGDETVASSKTHEEPAEPVDSSQLSLF
jgi:ankyrin repeat protein